MAEAGPTLDETQSSNTLKETGFEKSDLTHEEVAKCNLRIKTSPASRFFDETGFIIVNHRNPPLTFAEISEPGKDHFFEGTSLEDTQRISDALKVNSSFDSLQSHFPEFVIERPQTVEQAQVFKSDSGTKIVIFGEENPEKSAQNVSDLLKEVDKITLKLGIKSSLEDYVVIVSPQIPFTLTHQDTEDKIIVLGTFGGVKVDSKDAQHTLAHEVGHGKFQKGAKENNHLRIDALEGDNVLEASLAFFNEGVAEYTGLNEVKMSPRDELKKRYTEMFPQARTDLEAGILKGKYESDDIWKWINDSKSPRIMASIHSRLLPAAIIQFCEERKIQISSLISKQLETAQVGVAEIAQTYNVDASDLSFDEYYTAYKLRKVGKEPDYDLIKTIMEKQRLQPFDLLGKVLGMSEEEASKAFLGWLKT